MATHTQRTTTHWPKLLLFQRAGRASCRCDWRLRPCLARIRRGQNRRRIRFKTRSMENGLKPAFHGACFSALICAALLFFARVNNCSADNPFPWRRLSVHIGHMLLKYIRAHYASQYANKMTNLQLEWLSPESTRFTRRQADKKRFGSYFCPRGH